MCVCVQRINFVETRNQFSFVKPPYISLSLSLRLIESLDTEFGW